MSGKNHSGTLKERVEKYLFEAIISGELKPGQRIKIIPLAAALDMSQAPVREAVHCLAACGYLEMIPNVGARVRQFSAEEVAEIYMLREALETAGLRGAGKAYAPLAELLGQELRRMRKAAAQDSFRDYARHNASFHRHLAAFAGNARLLAMWDGLHIPRFITYKIKDRGMSLQNVADLHFPIIRGLEENDPEKAIQAVYSHYRALAAASPAQPDGNGSFVKT